MNFPMIIKGLMMSTYVAQLSHNLHNNGFFLTCFTTEWVILSPEPDSFSSGLWNKLNYQLPSR